MHESLCFSPCLNSLEKMAHLNTQLSGRYQPRKEKNGLTGQVLYFGVYVMKLRGLPKSMKQLSK